MNIDKDTHGSIHSHSSSEHQYMATLHGQSPEEPRLVFIKGGVEAILERCTQTIDENGLVIALPLEKIHLDVKEMAEAGLRVLSLCPM